MNYRIEISSIAEAEADSAFLRLSQISSSVVVFLKAQLSIEVKAIIINNLASNSKSIAL
jgi:hypothetical protein